MARRRFFVQQVRRGVAELTGADADHLVRVLRVEVGQVYELSDDQNLYLARVTAARKSEVSFEVIEALAAPVQTGRLTLIAALIKFDRFEWMLEKATELGVDEILPCETIRSERGLMQAATKRRARWARVAFESSQQARRARLPLVLEAVPFRVGLSASAASKLILDEDEKAMPILNVLRSMDGIDFDLALLVGPEGGWTAEERTLAIQNGWVACSLGETILRAETAAISGLSICRAWMSR